MRTDPDPIELPAGLTPEQHAGRLSKQRKADSLSRSGAAIIEAFEQQYADCGAAVPLDDSDCAATLQEFVNEQYEAIYGDVLDRSVNEHTADRELGNSDGPVRYHTFPGKKSTYPAVNKDIPDDVWMTNVVSATDPHTGAKYGYCEFLGPKEAITRVNAALDAERYDLVKGLIQDCIVNRLARKGATYTIQLAQHTGVEDIEELFDYAYEHDLPELPEFFRHARQEK